MKLICYFRFVLVMMGLFLAPVLTPASENVESRPGMNTTNMKKSENENPIKNDFSKGTRKWNTYASFAGGDRGKGNLYALHFGYGKFLWDQFSFNVDIFGAYIRSGIDDNGLGYGLDLIFRKHFLMKNDDTYSVYLDVGGGFEVQSTEFAGTRHFNFRVLGGGGFDGYQVHAGLMMPFPGGR